MVLSSGETLHGNKSTLITDAPTMLSSHWGMLTCRQNATARVPSRFSSVKKLHCETSAASSALRDLCMRCVVPGSRKHRSKKWRAVQRSMDVLRDSSRMVNLANTSRNVEPPGDQTRGNERKKPAKYLPLLIIACNGCGRTHLPTLAQAAVYVLVCSHSEITHVHL